MGQKLAVSLDDYFHPESAPRIDRPPTFDPLYGFPKGRKPREMQISWEELEALKFPIGARDYCAHKAVAWRKCCWDKAPFATHYCHGARHAYALCQYDDYLQRMKEFEREKRLLQRKFRKEKGQLMNTIAALCTQRTPFENLDRLLQSLDAIRIRISVADQHILASSLWNVYTQLAETQPSGVQFDFELLLLALSVSLKCNSSDLAQNALSAMVFVIERVGFPACAIVRRLNSLIINSTSISETIRLQTLTRLNSVLSVSSMLHEHFDKFASRAVELLKTDAQLPIELVDLVISLMETSVSLLRVSTLISLQKHVCVSALSDKPDNGILKLLNALLEHNHEGVPLPLQVASSVFQQGHFSYQDDVKFRTVLARGRSICQLISRPRRVANCANLPDIVRTDADDATNATNCVISLGEWRKTQKAEEIANPIQSNDIATASGARTLPGDDDNNADNEENESGSEENEDEESVEDVVEDVITLDDDEEETTDKIINDGGRGSVVVNGEKEFAFKTVDELLMDFTDE
uniref:NADH dehydrogenase [ubiquinone] 1 beta subcomplex subunit 7 n=1 Tax=Globodera rostochiensis TaxID=31243 RepID=A0A914I9Y8_GLORO